MAMLGLLIGLLVLMESIHDCQGMLQATMRWDPADPVPGCKDDRFYKDAGTGYTCSDWWEYTCRDRFGHPENDYGINTPQKQDRLVRSCPMACKDVDNDCGGIDGLNADVHIGVLNAKVGGLRPWQELHYRPVTELLMTHMYNTGGFKTNGTAATSKLALMESLEMKDVDESSRSLIREGVKLMAGPLSDHELALAAKHTAHNLPGRPGPPGHKILMLSPNSGDTDMFRRYPMLFGLSKPNDKFLLPIFKEINAVAGKVSVSYIAPELMYAYDMRMEKRAKICESIPKTANDAGLTFLRSFYTNKDWEEERENRWPEEVGNMVPQLLDSRPDVVVCCEGTDLCVEMIKQMRLRGADQPSAIILLEDAKLSGWLTWPKELFDHNYADGHMEQSVVELLRDVIVVSEWDRTELADEGDDEESKYASDTLARLLKVPKQGMANFYAEKVAMIATPVAAAILAQFQVMLAAVENTSTLDPDTLADTLKKMDIETVLGRIRFDENGQCAGESAAVQLGVVWNREKDSQEDILQLDISRITPKYRAGTQAIRYPMMSWRNSICLERYLTSIDDRSYGFVNGECQECDMSSVQEWNFRAGEKICRKCGNGTEEIDMKCIECEPGFSLFRPASETVAEASHYCEHCVAGKYQKAPGQSSCDNCEAGRYSANIASSKCTDCQEVAKKNGNHPYFSLEGSDHCIPCPPGAICEANEHGLFASYTNQAGYYLFQGNDHRRLAGDDPKGTSVLQPGHSQNGHLHRCEHGDKGEACLSHGQCYKDKNGVTTMEGPMCGACKPGFAKAGNALSLCQECHSLAWSITAVFLNGLFILGQSCLLFTLCLSINFTRREDIWWPIIKLMFNYLHMSSVVFSLSGKHGLYFFDAGLLFDWLYKIIGLSGNIMLRDATCVAWHVAPDYPIPRFWTLLGATWIPMLLVGSCVMFGFRKVLRLLTRREPNAGYEYYVMWFAMSVYLFLPRISGLLITTWNCKKFEDYRVLVDTRVECYSEENMVWRLIGGSGVAVFSVGLPLAMIFVLKHYYEKDHLQGDSVAKMFGFLYSGFEPRYYYFESFYMIRKLLFQVIPVLAIFKGRDDNATGRLQNSAAALVAAVSFSFHLAFTPYDNRGYFILDRIEQASLQAVIITSFVQLWALDTEDAASDDWDPTYRSISRAVLALIVLVAHLRFWFMASWGLVRKFVRGMWDAYSGQFQRLQSGWVKICPNGFIMERMRESEELLLTTMFQELVDVQIMKKQKIDFDVLLGGVQNIVLRAHQERLQANVARLDQVSHRFARARNLVNSLLSPDGRLSRTILTLLNNLEKISGIGKDVKFLDKLKAMQDDANALKEFSSKNVARTIGQKFSVEELHASMMLVGDDIVAHARRVGIAQRAEKLGYRKQSIIVTGARGGGRKTGNASDSNGDWVPDGLQAGSRVYRKGTDGVLRFDEEDSQAAKELGTPGKSKWIMFINGNYRYFNESESVEVPCTGWTAIPGCARGTPKISPALNDPDDVRRVESINVTGARGGGETGFASDLNGDWAPAGLRNGCPAYKIHQDGILCFEEEDSHAARNLGTGKPKWTMFINGHFRYYNEAESVDVPSSGWIAVTDFAKGSPKIAPSFYDPEQDPAALTSDHSEVEETQWTMIRHLREELEHANNQISRLSRPGAEEDEDAPPVPTKVPAASSIGKSHALEDVHELERAKAPQGDTKARLGEPPERAAPGDTVLEIKDEYAGAQDKQVGIELKEMSLRLMALEETLKKEKDTAAKWQMRNAEQQAKTRRMEEEMEAVKRRARQEVEAANELQSKAGKAVLELQDQLKLERQRNGGTVNKAEIEKQLQLEAAKEAAGHHLMSSSFMAPSRK